MREPQQCQSLHTEWDDEGRTHEHHCLLDHGHDGDHRNDRRRWTAVRGTHGEVDCATCGAELAHLGEGLRHLEATGHEGVTFVGSDSGRVWRPM